MNKTEFLDLLRYYFRNAKKSEVEEILADYEAHFEEGKKRGLTEEAIAKELGSPKDIYESYTSEGVVDEKSKSVRFTDDAKEAATAAARRTREGAPPAKWRSLFRRPRPARRRGCQCGSQRGRRQCRCLGRRGGGSSIGRRGRRTCRSTLSGMLGQEGRDILGLARIEAAPGDRSAEQGSQLVAIAASGVNRAVYTSGLAVAPKPDRVPLLVARSATVKPSGASLKVNVISADWPSRRLVSAVAMVTVGAVVSMV